MKGWRTDGYPFEGVNTRPIAEWRVVWKHPRGRFLMVEYRVHTVAGLLSEPIRECFWAKPDGVQYLTDSDRGKRLTGPKTWKGC